MFVVFSLSGFQQSSAKTRPSTSNAGELIEYSYNSKYSASVL